MHYVIGTARPVDCRAMYVISRAAHTHPSYYQLVPLAHQEAYRAHYKDSPDRQNRYCERIISCLHDPSWCVLVAKVPHQGVVGYVLLRRESLDRYVLRSLFVHPKAQGHGIGEALLASVLSKTPAGSVVELQVIAANARAKALYEKYGFAETQPADVLFYGAAQAVMQRTNH